MTLEYRRPGVYLEEALLTGANETGVASSNFLFVGATPKGRSLDPVRVASWSDYVVEFGGFDKVQYLPAGEVTTMDVVSYLPYAVHSFFQNGGRVAYIQRAFDSGEDTGSEAFTLLNGVGTVPAFILAAKSKGSWGNTLTVTTVPQSTTGDLVYNLRVMLDGVTVETFTNISETGAVPGTKRIDALINDPVYGSRYIKVCKVAEDGAGDPIPGLPGVQEPVVLAGTGAGTNYAAQTNVPLEGGTDPVVTSGTGADLASAAEEAIAKIDGPLVVSISGYLDETGTYVAPDIVSSGSFDSGNVMLVDDGVVARQSGQTSANYKTQVTGTLSNRYANSPFVAAYSPWIIVPDPNVRGGTITVPPGGAVMGVINRTDTTRGFFKAPAGIEALITNALGVDTKFTESELGDLNVAGINVVRPVTGRGICVMGGRTRKPYGVDKYISARRTLVYLRETLRAGTEFAVFENNDSLLWSRLSSTADRILRPLWQSGGLRGTTAAEAYFIRCDASVNTPASIAAGEVRMDIGVALEYPAEFVVIRLTQFDQGTTSIEVQQNQ